MKKRTLVFSLLWATLACHNQKKIVTEKKEEGLFELFVEDPNSKPFFSDKKGVIGSNGMVASAHSEASKVGVDILKQGGNAFDAAVATHFALAVVFPFAGNIGGGGFAVIRDKDGNAQTLDFREKAPTKAHKDMYLDANGNVIDGLSTLGHLASGVPGSVDGMVELHKKMGKLSWEKILQPAINLAENGVILTEREALGFNNHKKVFQEVNGEQTPYFIHPLQRNWQKGDTLFQKDLAKTLRAIQSHKRAGFYNGEVAELLIKEMKKGIITQQDLDGYHSIWRKPMEGDYKNYHIITMAPPSSGGIALVQLLKYIEPYPLKKWGWNADSTTQVIIEAERRVYADRAKWLGDSDFISVPTDTLLNQKYLQKRWQDFSFAHASSSKDVGGGKIAGYESNETTHFSVVDKEGNAIAVTTTLNGAYGSKVVVADAGFLMNNEMDDFSVKPGVPNMFGLVGTEANAIAANKRMLSSMTPTIVEKEGKLFLVVGTPGGSTIITSVFQTIVNVLEHGMTMQQAVNALKFHHQWLPDKTFYELNAFTPKTIEKLSTRGYDLESQKGTLGRMDCIMLRADGSLEGASDPRADNTSEGY